MVGWDDSATTVITRSIVQANFWWISKPPSSTFHPEKYVRMSMICLRVYMINFGWFHNDLIVWWIFSMKIQIYRLLGPLYTSFRAPNLGHCFPIWTNFSQFWRGFLACFAYSTTMSSLWPMVPQEKSVLIAIKIISDTNLCNPVPPLLSNPVFVFFRNSYQSLLIFSWPIKVSLTSFLLAIWWPILYSIR